MGWNLLSSKYNTKEKESNEKTLSLWYLAVYTGYGIQKLGTMIDVIWLKVN